MYSVFFVDDEPWVLIGLKKIIDWEKHGFIICGQADNGQQAFERIIRLQPDLVISDIRMPEMSGLSLLERLREEEIRTKVIFISGYSEFEYAQKALQYGSIDYLLKPLEETELIESLTRASLLLKSEKDKEKNYTSEKEGYLSEKVTVEKMVAYIHSHFAQPLSLQVLSQTFLMSEGYISSLIKKNTGKTFSDHLIQSRIQKATELLQYTNLSIEEIAELVGYADYFYFVKVYKRATGLSPTSFRKQL